MRIAIITDAWSPQVNGVVRTLQAVIAELEAQGHAVLVISPEGRPSLPCPTYPEIRLALARPAAIGRRIEAFAADAVHIATEGPLGLSARAWCLAHGLAFTTAYHTQFPYYVARRTGIDPALPWRFIRWFHAPASAVLVSTPSVERELRGHGLTQVRRWGRGVGPEFTAAGPLDPDLLALPGPVLLYVGRLAVEKNLEAFLALDVPGSKVVVGDGPARTALAARYPDASFLGVRGGAQLAATYRSADCFVFPSRTDTFGLVMIEALACGAPVAAFPTTGPIDIVTSTIGALDDDLATAVAAALIRDRAACARYGAGFTWTESARQFLDALVPLERLARAA